MIYLALIKQATQTTHMLATEDEMRRTFGVQTDQMNELMDRVNDNIEQYHLDQIMQGQIETQLEFTQLKQRIKEYLTDNEKAYQMMEQLIAMWENGFILMSQKSMQESFRLHHSTSY